MRISTPFPQLPGHRRRPGLAVPAKIMRHIWAALKKLDTIVPGVLHPSTIMYYPEIKMYANKPVFLDRHFRVSGNVFMVGDGAGTSRGITGAWASGIRAAEDTGRELTQGGPAVPIAANIRNPLLLFPRHGLPLAHHRQGLPVAAAVTQVENAAEGKEEDNQRQPGGLGRQLQNLQSDEEHWQQKPVQSDRDAHGPEGILGAAQGRR